MIAYALEKLKWCQICLATEVSAYNSMVLEYMQGRESAQSLSDAHEKMLDSVGLIGADQLTAQRDNIESMLCPSNGDYISVETYADPRSSMAPMIEELSYTERGEVVYQVVQLIDLAIQEMACPDYMAEYNPSETDASSASIGLINPASASPCLDEAVDMLTLLLN